MRRNHGFVCGLAALILWGLVPSPLQADVLAGVLKCRVDGGVSFFVGNRHDVTCLYRPNGRGPKQYLIGTSDLLGVAIGFRFAGTAVWDVRSALHDVGNMAGLYTGVGGDAKFFEGPDGKILVGGEEGRVSLKPSTVGGPSGFEVSAGIGRLELVRTTRTDLVEGLDDDDIE